MASWNEISPDPDIQELSRIAEDAKGIRGDDDTDDALHEPATSDDYTMNQLVLPDRTDDLSGSFDGEIGLPRA